MFKEYRIFEIGEVVGGGTPSTNNPDYWNGDIPWITPNDLTGYSSVYISHGKNYITESGLRSGTKLLPAGTLLFTSRAPIGYMAIANNPICTNQGFKSIICNDKCNNLYLYYYLKQNLPYIKLFGTGATFPEISGSVMKKIKVNIIADIKYQKSIASILYAYDDLIENNNKRIKILESMAQELYKEWFVRLRFSGYNDIKIEDGLPADWEIKKLSDFGISLDTGSRPTGGIDASLTDGVPSLGAEAINALAEFDYSSVKLVPVDFYNSMKRGKNTGNDILVYKDGAYIGKVTLFRNDFPYKNYAVNEHVFLLKPTDELYSNYLYFTLHQDAYFYLMQNLNRNAAQPGLSREDIKQIKITVPSETTIKRFNDVVEPILNKIFVLAKQNANLAKQRDLLLPRLMSGKLEIKGTDDA